MIITEETAELSTPSGPMRTYVYRPAAPGRYPGIVLFSEIFQQTGPIKRAASLYAGHGFIVVVPEIYHELEPAGTVLAYDQAGADKGNCHKTAKKLKSYDDDARACIAYLSGRQDCTGDLGTIGICIGGHLAFRCAMNREIKAAICFYATDIHKHGLGEGMKDDSLERCGEIKGELKMIWGRQDPHIPPEGRALIYKTLGEKSINYSWHEFNGQHAFMRDEGPRYDPELALHCYGLAVGLLKRKLSPGDQPIEDSAPRESRH